jgi:ATP-dependent Clp protease adaptor protein ClpS
MPPMQLSSQLIPQKADEPAEKTFREPLYRVIIHNDDITSMDFVTHILVTIFGVPGENALTIMYAAHLTGAAYVQTLPRLEARRRINKAHFAARMKNYPLKFSMERE